MKITCLHGYFIFEPKYSSEVTEFNAWYKKPIAMSGDHYTFKPLVDLPDYSIAGSTYLNVPATKTIEGKPWDIMRANGLVYDFVLEVMRPISMIGNIASPTVLDDHYVDGGLYLPGSTLKFSNRKFSGYTCFTDFEMFTFNYSEFYYD